MITNLDSTNLFAFSSEDIRAGSIAELKLNLSNTKGLQSFELVLGYDKSILSIPGSTAVFTTTEITNGWILVINSSIPGKVAIAGFGTTPLERSSGEIINLNLRVKGDINQKTTTIKLLSASINETDATKALKDFEIEIRDEIPAEEKDIKAPIIFLNGNTGNFDITYKDLSRPLGVFATNEPVSWLIDSSYEDSKYFSINSSGIIKFLNPANALLKNNFLTRIVARDQSGNSSKQAVRIRTRKN